MIQLHGFVKVGRNSNTRTDSIDHSTGNGTIVAMVVMATLLTPMGHCWKQFSLALRKLNRAPFSFLNTIRLYMINALVWGWIRLYCRMEQIVARSLSRRRDQDTERSRKSSKLPKARAPKGEIRVRQSSRHERLVHSNSYKIKRQCILHTFHLPSYNPQFNSFGSRAIKGRPNTGHKP